MQRVSRGVLTVFLLNLLVVFTAYSQENSPYSRFGLGDLYKSTLSSQKGIGHMGTAVQFRNRINPVNPASYSQLGLTTFEPGLYFHRSNYTIGDSTYRSDDASIDHFVFGFPLSDKWGLVFGLLPFSSSNYHFETSGFSAQNNVAFEESFKGEGKLYKLILGSGYRIGPVSFGLQGGLVFGKYDNINLLSFPETSAILNSRRLAANKFSGFTGEAGVQYRLKIDDTQFLIFGATATLGTKLRIKQDNLWQRFVYSDNRNINVVDTVQFETGKTVTTQLPTDFSLGVSYNINQKLMLGVEYSIGFWEDFDDVIHGEQMANASRTSFGVEYTPNMPPVEQLLRQTQESGRLDNYYQRINYRLGGYFGQTPVIIDGDNVNEFGITFGVGLPVRSFFNKINLAMEIGSRGSNTGNLFTDNFVKGYIGLTLNDRWFVQRRFD